MFRWIGIFVIVLMACVPAMALDILVTDSQPEAATQPGDSGDSDLAVRQPGFANHTAWVEPALIGTGIFLVVAACTIPLTRKIL